MSLAVLAPRLSDDEEDHWLEVMDAFEESMPDSIAEFAAWGHWEERMFWHFDVVDETEFRNRIKSLRGVLPGIAISQWDIDEGPVSPEE